MRLIFSFLVCFLITIHINAQNWELVWSDEFDLDNLNTDYWSHEIGTGNWGWGNGELQYYQSDNVTLLDGKLIIEAREEPQGIPGQWDVPYYYSSSRINTRNKFDFKYGKVEAKIKTVDGQGFWPAFWLLPNGACWPEDGEIDIMEQWGNDGPTNQTTGAAHLGNGCQGSSTYQSWSSSISESYADDFHIYSIIWYENYIGWYVDGDLKYFITPESFSSEFEWPFNQDSWYLILNLAITNSGTNNNTIFPSNIQVDYVRVYQTSDVMGCTNPSSTNYNALATFDDGSCIELINFNVDFNCTDINPETVYITGPFNDWCCGCHPLSDLDGNGIWSGTYSFDNINEQFEYKYCYDNWAGQENLIDDMQNGGTCAPITDYNSYANRLIFLTGNDVTTNDVYGQCSECLAGCTDSNALNYDVYATYDNGSCEYNCIPPIVSFSVNMDGPLPEGYSNVVINGSWNNWQGWGIILNDNDNDFIWEGSAELPIGTNEYVVAYTGQADSWLGWGVVGSAPIGSPCDYFPLDTYGNYGFNLACGDTVQLPTICFSSCENCYQTINGCTNILACNYNSSANVDDNSCTYADNNADCEGNCLTGFTSVNGSCVAIVNGCTDATACNHNSSA
ncbi:MAG: hypothetical protein CMP55_02225, partial [Flavobacteriales bacterium]|nr:hypothetical protein [Flavobacteriales bacterium]